MSWMQVHYGRASMSPLSCLPAYFVFGQQNLDIERCAQRLTQYAAKQAGGSGHTTLLVFLDQVLLHAVTQLQECVHSLQQVGACWSPVAYPLFASRHVAWRTCMFACLPCTSVVSDKSRRVKRCGTCAAWHAALHSHSRSASGSF